MFRNFFKTGLRNMRKNATYSFLNVFGLAIGIACAALIFLWVEDEVGYDSHNLKKERLYVVLENEVVSDHVRTHASTPGPMAPVIKDEITAIANTCRFVENGKPVLFEIAGKPVYAAGRFVDSSVFSMFTLPFIEGNANAAFLHLYSIVITERLARKFFGNEKRVLGRTVRMDNKQDYVISGVLKNLPDNSTIQFEWLAPFEIFYNNNDYIRKWTNNSLTTYVELNSKASTEAVNRQLSNYLQRRDPNSNIHLFLFGMNDWHLRWQFDNGKMTGGGRIQYVHLFSLVAWIILFIACINFMNLATAQSEKRAKEVGVRKVLGAQKRSLVVQFIGEALFMALLASALAVVLILLALPAFNTLVQKDIALHLQKPQHLSAFLAITLICGLISGSYPALYLSSFKPVSVLKTFRVKSGGADLMRKGLVVLQFSVSIVLIIATFIIYRQIQHVKSRELGFNRNDLLAMNVQGNMRTQFDVIRQDLINTGVVENVSVSDHETLYDGNNTDGLTWDGKSPGSKVVISTRYVTSEFFSTSGLSILAGRGIDRADTMNNGKINVMITSSLAKMMGSGNPISKSIWFEGDSAHRANVVGVVNDFVYGNMYGKPDPVMFFWGSPQNATVMYIRTRPHADIPTMLAKVEAVMRKDNPTFPFEYKFVDDQFNEMFSNETLMGTLSRVFALLAILISCLGLFGLAAYMAERRTQEIGIRKTLGASVPGIAGLLSRDFVKLVLIAAVIAFPVAWWVMKSWLQDYQYRTDISPWIFIGAAAAALLIALATISFQAIKAALANPVNSLRSE